MKDLSENEQRELIGKFRDAIISAYPSLNSLKMMFEPKFGVNLNTIINDTSTYSSQVHQLLTEWAISQGQFNNLLQAAYEGNSGNEKLKKFYESVNNRENQKPNTSGRDIVKPLTPPLINPRFKFFCTIFFILFIIGGFFNQILIKSLTTISSPTPTNSPIQKCRTIANAGKGSSIIECEEQNELCTYSISGSIKQLKGCRPKS
ncbi:hypothetical protein NIES2100_16690 [Calothrix sp. NIES-2100]|uniref:effector-associated domain EAD1-containing protein n=1 Tax=Calothrix sp. NIES-2100 TaxID=1954172 RepID=UPI000B60714C|nr:hypothetical protein NIES2100_16690 [Calothrix sp. NIES-2100]